MNRPFGALLCLFIGILSANGADETRVAVSIRYLQIKGTSHAHIYLYSGDGKFIRQLTRNENGQDVDPVFSPDGRQIVFSRELKTNKELWSVNTAGTNAHKLNAPPEWYPAASQVPPHFTIWTAEEERENARTAQEPNPAPSPNPTTTSAAERVIAPDQSVELILDERPVGEKGDWGTWFRLHDLGDNSDVLLKTFPGFEPLQWVLHLRGREQELPYLIHPPLRAVFFWTHLNSTDGSAVYALDLNRKRIVRLGPNWCDVIPIPNEPSFFTLTEELYLPLGDGKRTVNCSYLERWDAEFHKIRYARTAPAIFGGASVWRNDAPPLTMHWAVRYE